MLYEGGTRPPTGPFRVCLNRPMRHGCTGHGDRQGDNRDYNFRPTLVRNHPALLTRFIGRSSKRQRLTGVASRNRLLAPERISVRTPLRTGTRVLAQAAPRFQWTRSSSVADIDCTASRELSQVTEAKLNKAILNANLNSDSPCCASSIVSANCALNRHVGQTRRTAVRFDYNAKLRCCTIRLPPSNLECS